MANSFIAILVAISLAAIPGTWGQTTGTSSSNVGDGTLIPSPGSPYQAGSRDSGLVSGDLNGDGLPDLVTGGSGLGSNNLTILLAVARGGFVAAPPIPVSWSTTSLALGDFNGDGKLDIAADGGSLSPNVLQVFLGDGHGGFSPMPPFPYNTLGVDGLGQIGVGDFNHDGLLDLVVGGTSIGSTTAGYIAVLLGDGTGNFTSHRSRERDRYSLLVTVRNWHTRAKLPCGGRRDDRRSRSERSICRRAVGISWIRPGEHPTRSFVAGKRCRADRAIRRRRCSQHSDGGDRVMA